MSGSEGSINLSDTRDFLDVTLDSGTFSKKFESGAVITITLDKGKIVKCEAKDEDGNPHKTFFLKMQSSDLQPVRPEVHEAKCYACETGATDGNWGGGHTNCSWIPCGWLLE